MRGSNPVYCELHLNIHMYVYLLFAVKEIRVIFTLHRIMMPDLYIWVSFESLLTLKSSNYSAHLWQKQYRSGHRAVKLWHTVHLAFYPVMFYYYTQWHTKPHISFDVNMFGCIRAPAVMMMLWTLLVMSVPVHSDNASNIVKVKGLVHETMNVTLDLQNIHINRGSNLVCTSEVPYVSFSDQDDHLETTFSGTEI